MKKQDNDEIIVLEPITEIDKVVDIPALLKEWENIPELKPDIGVKDEKFKAVKKGHLAFVSARNKVEAARKRLKAPALAFGKEVDAKAKEYKEMMASTEEALFIQRHKVEKYEEEQKQKAIDAENERVRKIQDAILYLQSIPSTCINKSSKAIMDIYKSISVPSEDIFQERIDEAVQVYTASMNTIEGMIEAAKKAEQAEELIKKEREAARKAKEEENRKAKLEAEKLAEEKRKFEEQKAAFEAEKRAAAEAAEKERLQREAEEFERLQKIEAEKRAAAEAAGKEAKEKEAQKLKQLEEQTIKKIEKKAISKIVEILDSWKAKPKIEVAAELMEAIIKDEIPGVKWSYNE